MTRNRAARAAEKLRQTLGIPASPSIDVYEVARRAGIEVVEADLDTECSALLLRREGRSICAVQANHPSNRKRFSIAHEIGHFVLHPKRESYDVFARDQRSSEGHYREEIEANAFAAELLMPSASLLSEVKRDVQPDRDKALIEELATRYKVSVEAMTYRLADLGLLVAI